MNLRSILFSVALLAAVGVSAQAPTFHYFGTTAPMDRSALKMVISAVNDMDPSAEVFHNDDYTVLQVKGNLSEAQFRSVITQAGVALRPGTVDPTTLHSPAPAGPPVYVVTNDPAADLQRYQAAAEAWNAAHPEQAVSVTPMHLNSDR